MAWDLDGVGQYARFAMSAALQAATGGPFTFAAIVNLDSATDGALIHMLDGTSGRHFLEVFSTFNWGTAAAAKSGPAGTGGGTTWVHIIMSKPTGTVPVEYTITDLTAATPPTSGTATGGNLANGAAPGAAGQIQVGRFALSATEYVDGKVEALWLHASYMNQATREALTTWSACVSAATAGGLGWAVRLDTLSTITDATGLGGNETGRFGTLPFTLASGPSGPFFGGGGITIQDASGGGGTAGSDDGRALGDSSGGTGTGGTTDGRALGSGSDGGGTAGSGDGRALGAGSDGGATAGTSDGLAVGDNSGGGGTSGSGDGRALGAGSDGLGTAGTFDGLALGDSSGGGGTSGSPDTIVTGAAPVVIQDVSGGSGTGGSGDGRALGDSSGGGGSAGATDGRTLGAGSGGGGTGGSPDVITIPGTPVTISDTSGGGGTGGSIDTAATDEVVHDTMVMPLLIKARDCLVTEVGKVSDPPSSVQIRPGATFTPMADATYDECCAGIAWVRPGQQVPTGGNWPVPLSDVSGPSRGEAVYYAVQIELGVIRCVPTVSDVEGSNQAVPTSEQWLKATQDAMDDAAALRRVICCLQGIYGTDAVLAGPIVPLQNEGNCGGQVVVVQLRAPACDCVG